MSTAVETDRNNTLFRIAARLARDVAAAGAKWDGFAARLAAVAIEIGLDPHEIPPTLASAWKAGQKSPTPWIADVSQRWIYVSGQDQFRHLESGSILKPAAFRTEFASVAPNEVKNFARFLTDKQYIDIVQDVAFEPDHPQGVIQLHGRAWYNAYVPSDVVAEEGDPTPFIAFLEFLVPEEGERAHLLKILAHLVRFPGKKLGHALILGSPEHGIGKSTLMLIMEQLMGTQNCRKATSEEIDSQYSAYIEGKLLVLIEELQLGQGRNAYNKLKDMITAEKSPMRKLYENMREVPTRDQVTPQRTYRLSVEAIGELLDYSLRGAGTYAGHGDRLLPLRRYLIAAICTLGRPDAIFDMSVAPEREQWIANLGLFALNPAGRIQTKKIRAVMPVAPLLASWLNATDEWFVCREITRHDPELNTAVIEQQAVDGIRSAWKGARKVLGIPDGWGPKRIRHSMATILANRRVDLIELEMAMGHRVIGKTSSRYAIFDPGYLATVRGGIEDIVADLTKVAGPALHAKLTQNDANASVLRA